MTTKKCESCGEEVKNTKSKDWEGVLCQYCEREQLEMHENGKGSLNLEAL